MPHALHIAFAVVTSNVASQIIPRLKVKQSTRVMLYKGNARAIRLHNPVADAASTKFFLQTHASPAY